MQRLIVTFARRQELKYLSHLDLLRLWSYAFRRAEVPLAYSQSATPHARFSAASPLPVGIISEAELMEVYLAQRIAPFYFARQVNGKLPRGLEIIQGEEVSLALPSLQSRLRACEYLVAVETDLDSPIVQARVVSFLDKRTLPWHHLRDKEVRRYDLRPLVEGLRLKGWQPGQAHLEMRLKSDGSGTGRPEQVALALGFEDIPISIVRTRLVLAPVFPERQEPPARGKVLRRWR